MKTGISSKEGAGRIGRHPKPQSLVSVHRQIMTNDPTPPPQKEPKPGKGRRVNGHTSAPGLETECAVLCEV